MSAQRDRGCCLDTGQLGLWVGRKQAVVDAEEEGWWEKEARNQSGEGFRGARETCLLQPHMFVHSHTYKCALTHVCTEHTRCPYDTHTSTCAHTTVHACVYTRTHVRAYTQHTCVHRDTHVSTHAHSHLPALSWPGHTLPCSLTVSHTQSETQELTRLQNRTAAQMLLYLTSVPCTAP